MYLRSRCLVSVLVMLFILLVASAAVIAQPSTRPFETAVCKGEAPEIAGLFSNRPGIKIAIARFAGTDAGAAKLAALSEKELLMHLEKAAAVKPTSSTEVRELPCQILDDGRALRAERAFNVDLLIWRRPGGDYKVRIARWTRGASGETRGLEEMRNLQAPSSATPRHEALRSFLSGVLALREERYQDAATLFSRPELEATETPSSKATSSKLLSAAALSILGRADDARALLEGALATCTATDAKCRGKRLELLAFWHQHFAVAVKAPELYKQALAEYRKDNELEGVRRVLNSLGQFYEKLGGAAQARSYYQELLQAEPSDEKPAGSELKPQPTGTDVGSIDKELIRRVIRRHINEVKLCYEQELTKNSNLAGRLVVRFVIGVSGNVGASSKLSSTMSSPPAEDCIVRAVGNWVFPKPEGGIVIVTYPLVLKSSSDSPPTQ